jgi:DNA-binding transcriptional LysR family regulator
VADALAQPVPAPASFRAPSRANQQEVESSDTSGVSLRLLNYFVVAAEELHFGRAAKRLGIAQPALSSAIKTLEARIGMSLMSRTTRHVELTSAGATILEHGQEVLRCHADLLRGMAAHRRSEASWIRLGYPGPFTGNLAAAGLRRMAQASSTRVTLQHLEAGQEVDSLLRQEVDLVLTSSPSETAADIGTLPLGTCDPVLLVAMDALPAISDKRLTRWQGLHIALADRAEAWYSFWSPSSFFAQPPSESAATFGVALDLVAAGHGAILAPRVAVVGRQREDIGVVPVFEREPIEFHLAWLADGRAPTGGNLIAAALRDALADANTRPA